METNSALRILLGIFFAAVLGLDSALGAGLVDKAKIDAALSGLTNSGALVGVSPWSTRMDARRTSARSARPIGRRDEP
jgi:hypothetical protein